MTELLAWIDKQPFTAVMLVVVISTWRLVTVNIKIDRPK